MMSKLLEDIKKFFGRMAAAVRKANSKKTKGADFPSSDAASRETAFAEVAHRVIEDVRKV